MDAADLLNVMRLVDDRLRESSVGISRYYLTGYSLGGWNAAYVAKLMKNSPSLGNGRTSGSSGSS